LTFHDHGALASGFWHWHLTPWRSIPSTLARCVKSSFKRGSVDEEELQAAGQHGEEDACSGRCPCCGADLEEQAPSSSEDKKHMQVSSMAPCTRCDSAMENRMSGGAGGCHTGWDSSRTSLLSSSDTYASSSLHGSQHASESGTVSTQPAHSHAAPMQPHGKPGGSSAVSHAQHQPQPAWAQQKQHAGSKRHAVGHAAAGTVKTVAKAGMWGVKAAVKVAAVGIFVSKVTQGRLGRLPGGALACTALMLFRHKHGRRHADLHWEQAGSHALHASAAAGHLLPGKAKPTDGHDSVSSAQQSAEIPTNSKQQLSGQHHASAHQLLPHPSKPSSGARNWSTVRTSMQHHASMVAPSLPQQPQLLQGGSPPWLTLDIQGRLVAQKDSLEISRALARGIMEWRAEQGIDFVDVHTAADAALAAAIAHEIKHGRHRGPSEAATSGAAAVGSQAAAKQATASARSSASGAAAAGSAAGVSLGPDLGGLAPWLPPALRSVLNFSTVRKSVGHGIMWADDGRGLGVLWIKTASWGTLKSQVRSLLSQQWAAAHALASAAASRLAPSQPHPASSKQQQQSAGLTVPQPPSWQAEVALHFALTNEWLWGWRLGGRPVAQGRFVQVVDMKGTGSGTAMGDGLSALRAIMSAAHQYPQRLFKTLVINPPGYVSFAWSMLTHVLPPPVVAKIVLVKGGRDAVLRELQAFLPPELIPQEYGGQCSATDPGDYPTQRLVEDSMARAAAVALASLRAPSGGSSSGQGAGGGVTVAALPPQLVPLLPWILGGVGASGASGAGGSAQGQEQGLGDGPGAGGECVGGAGGASSSPQELGGQQQGAEGGAELHCRVCGWTGAAAAANPRMTHPGTPTTSRKAARGSRHYQGHLKGSSEVQQQQRSAWSVLIWLLTALLAVVQLWVAAVYLGLLGS